MSHLLSTKEKPFTGAKHIKEFPKDLMEQPQRIQKTLSFFEQLPIIEKLKMWFTMGMLILDDEKACLDVTVLQYRVYNLKKLRSFISSLILMHKLKTPTIPVADKSEVHFRKIVEGIIGLYEEENHSDESVKKCIEKLSTSKIDQLLLEFSRDIRKTLSPQPEAETTTVPIPQEFLQQMQDLIKQFTD